MKKEKSQKVLLSGIAMVVLFILWTVAISLIDVQPIGPQNSSVGFATLNGFIHSLTGVHMAIYTVTDWLGLIPLCFILGFALLGLIQLIKRKSLFKVDSSILVLGAFYIVVMAAYLFFEFYVVNYRPVLINGFLEASYGDLRADAVHHDGTNHYLYRVFKDGVTDTQIENLQDKIYNGKATRADITRVTKRLGDDIAGVYGFPIMKAETIKPKGAMKMELTYTMQGDYLIPDLTVPESPKIGKYGMLRRTFLREHRDGIYTGMLLEGTLNSHLEEVDAQANRMMDKLTEQMKTLNGVTEQMKSKDQMKWVQLMNSIRNSAEEVVLRDLIYA